MCFGYCRWLVFSAAIEIQKLFHNKWSIRGCFTECKRWKKGLASSLLVAFYKKYIFSARPDVRRHLVQPEDWREEPNLLVLE